MDRFCFFTQQWEITDNLQRTMQTWGAEHCTPSTLSPSRFPACFKKTNNFSWVCQQEKYFSKSMPQLVLERAVVTFWAVSITSPSVQPTQKDVALCALWDYHSAAEAWSLMCKRQVRWRCRTCSQFSYCQALKYRWRKIRAYFCSILPLVGLHHFHVHWWVPITLWKVLGF